MVITRKSKFSSNRQRFYRPENNGRRRRCTGTANVAKTSAAVIVVVVTATVAVFCIGTGRVAATDNTTPAAAAPGETVYRAADGPAPGDTGKPSAATATAAPPEAFSDERSDRAEPRAPGYRSSPDSPPSAAVGGKRVKRLRGSADRDANGSVDDGRPDREDPGAVSRSNR